ncbi:MAG: hypothetical protein ABIH11_05310 [Candidatus Altiarchaeota archaeon]
MKRTCLTLLILLTACLNSSAVEDKCRLTKYYSQMVKLGDDTDGKFDHLIWSNPVLYELNFSLKANVEYANLSFKTYRSGGENSVLINGKEISRFCKNIRSYTWDKCVVKVPPNALRPGENTLAFRSNRKGGITSNYYDVILDDVILDLKYVDCLPRVIGEKTYSPIPPSIGDALNFSVVITNVGILNAVNVTVFDDPIDPVITEGEVNFTVDLLAIRNVYRNQYTLKPSKAGIIKSGVVRIEYYDEYGNNYTNIIDPINVYVRPKEPKIRVIKEASSPDVYIDRETRITILLVNLGETDAHNVRVKDYLFGNIYSTNGSTVFTFDVIPAYENRTIEYGIKSNGTDFISSGAYVMYQDDEGRTYNSTSNYVDLTSKTATEKGDTSKPTTIIVLLLISIIILSVVFLILQKR